MPVIVLLIANVLQMTQTGRLLLLALLVVSATAVLLATGGKSAGQTPARPTAASAWLGLVGSRPRVAPGQRVIVVLKTPSLAQRVAAAGGVVGTRTERLWTATALSAQKLLVSRLALSGVSVHPDYSFARVLNGFSAVLDPSAIPLIERDEDVVGVGIRVNHARPQTAEHEQDQTRRRIVAVAGVAQRHPVDPFADQHSVVCHLRDLGRAP